MRKNRYDDYLSHLGGNYFMDLIHILKYEAFDGINRCYDSEDAFFAQGGKIEYDAAGERKEDPAYERGYLRGYAHAYSRVISVMIKQADIFGIPLTDLCLEDIDPGKDLLGGV
jgi:hypothetical protein